MVIIAGWESKTLGALIGEGKIVIQTGPFGTVLSAREFVKYGIPVVAVREIREGYIQIFDETPCVSMETYNRLSKYNLAENDLVFARKGNVERSALIPRTKTKYFLGSDGICLRVITKNLLSQYLFYAIQSNTVRSFLIQNAYGTTMAGLNENILSSIPLFLPVDIDEQSAIAEALSDVDSLISSLQKLIEKKKAIKQGAMQELLTGKRRLPGFVGEWSHKSLGSLGELSREVINPQSFSETFFYEYSMPAYDNGRHPEKTQGGSMHSSRLKIYGEVILFNKLNVRQRRIWHVKKCLENAVCSSEFLPYHSSKILPEFVYQVLMCDKVTVDFENMSTGTSNSQKRITPSDFLDYKIYFPETSEQQAIAQVLSDMDSEIEQLEKKLAKYQQIKQGMMQELLTGRIRLVEDENNATDETAKMEKALR